MTSDKKNVSLLADIFVKKGLSDIIISPGSRNAPIVIAFAGQENIRALSIIDERSAGFFALGMAQQTGKAVAVACTSGSAMLNYAPAIAEAYYQKIPLLILTADRPPEMIDHGDGQTIRQKGVYKNYIKASYELPVVVDDPATMQIAEDIINHAIDQTHLPEPGPVHINIPLREPLYGSSDEKVEGRSFDTFKNDSMFDESLFGIISEEWNEAEKVLIIAGQMPPDVGLNFQLSEVAKLNKVVVLTETTSNLNDPLFIDCLDNVISTITDEEAKLFQPDLLISLGGQVVSKMVKKYLRLNPPKKHWHISPSNEEMDTYFSLSRIIPVTPDRFFKQLSSGLNSEQGDFSSVWKSRNLRVANSKTKCLSQVPYSDLFVWNILFEQIPEKSILHLGNSTPVRYSQLFGSLDKFIYRSNRGVSGIDGQVSTAAGEAFVTDKINTIVTGDLGFFYDSNALMNHHLKPNLKIIVINNGGGGIFRFIPGPDTSPHLETFFATKHNWSAEKIAEAYNIIYYKADDEDTLIKTLPDFYDEGNRPALLEIFTPAELNASILRSYFKTLKE